MASTASERHTAKEQAREVLREVATRRGLITYVELVEKITAVRFHQRSRDLHRLLGDISEDENARGAGMLSVVVVAKDSQRPGPGFFELARKLGRKFQDENIFWQDELERVYETHAAVQRSSVSERAISVRLDDDAEEALDFLVEAGLSRSEAIRAALVDAAGRRRGDALADEASRLAEDADDRAAIAEVAVFMDALSAEG